MRPAGKASRSRRSPTSGSSMAFEHHGFWQPMDTLRDKNQLEELWAVRARRPGRSGERERRFWAARASSSPGHTGFKGGWLALWLHAARRRSPRLRPRAADRPELCSRPPVSSTGSPRTRAPTSRISRSSWHSSAPHPEVVFHLAAQPLGARELSRPARHARQQCHGHGARAGGGARGRTGEGRRDRHHRQGLREPRPGRTLSRGSIRSAGATPTARARRRARSWRPATGQLLRRRPGIRRLPRRAPATSSAAATGRRPPGARLPARLCGEPAMCGCGLPKPSAPGSTCWSRSRAICCSPDACWARTAELARAWNFGPDARAATSVRRAWRDWRCAGRWGARGHVRRRSDDLRRGRRPRTRQPGKPAPRSIGSRGGPSGALERRSPGTRLRA